MLLTPLLILLILKDSGAFYTGLNDDNYDHSKDGDKAVYWSHRMIGNQILKNVDETFFDERRRAWVFLGNCERDMSQFFHRNHTFGTLVNGMLSVTARFKLGLPMHFDSMGTYRPEEHFDNGLWLKDELNETITIDPRSNMASYISKSFDTIDFVLRVATLSFWDHNEEEALRQLGSAMHTMEDFYAHSNFVELAVSKYAFESRVNETTDLLNLRNSLYRSYFTFTGNETLEPCASNEKTKEMRSCYPVVTGLHVPHMSGTLMNLLSYFKTQILRRFGNWTLDDSLSIDEQLDDEKRGYLTELLTPAATKLANALDKIHDHVANSYMYLPIQPKSLLTTHSQLSKDAIDNVLHGLAGQCAVDSLTPLLRDVFNMWSKVNDTQFDTNAPLQALSLKIRKTFIHPESYDPSADDVNEGVGACLSRVKAWLTNPLNAQKHAKLSIEEYLAGTNRL